MIPAVFKGDGNDVKIHAAGQATIKDHFLVAKMSSLFQRREVQKLQIDRFFDLIDVRACQKDLGDVGFTLSNSGHGVRIKIRPLHGLKDF